MVARASLHALFVLDAHVRTQTEGIYRLRARFEQHKTEVCSVLQHVQAM